MASLARHYPQIRIWRFTQHDSVFVVFATLHTAILLTKPMAPLIAIGLWWNANTIAHNFIHKPFFARRWMNLAFSAILSLLMGIPQSLWRDRHLAHHSNRKTRLRSSWQLMWETALVACLWGTLLLSQPHFFLTGYIPGYVAGLALCAAQGYWEHAAGGPTSHYGRPYNLLCFNDGYHAEHHADPSRHWTQLPSCVEPDAMTSVWPAPLRWMELHPLEVLERVVLRSPPLQSFVLNRHKRALGALLQQLPQIHSVSIIGGGLFPRTALILRDLLPAARLTIIDLSERNLETAHDFLGYSVHYRQARFDSTEPQDSELTVIPLCFQGDREAIYRQPPTPLVLVHDWIWQKRGSSVIVSRMLLKRLNLVRR